MALTAKMKAFAQAIVDGMSKKDAAISAGYPEKSAMQQGSKLSKNPEIIAYIDQYSAAKKLTSENKKLTPEKPKVKPASTHENDNPLDDEDYAKDDPLQFLIDVMNNSDDMLLRFNAAKAALPYKHGKVAEKGKKESKADGAKQTATSGGKFGTLDSQLRN
ncbi:terminase small subunit [Acinetobacter chengduensis]|uniref:Terminase small subunit n=1 Tax=Acinetobacter chengduensis TaxID=2420890 RepID=A0ABX9TRT0_9GAMM|nr:terminase small subunit [Acinetobacter chengduensis]RLL17996.1 terminase small subunit [Acinetobacter chengduensis]